MIITSSHFIGRLDKIAQALTSITSSSSIKSGSSSGSSSGLSNPLSNDTRSYGNRNRSKLDISSTMSKSRERADLQPLHKDSKVISGPTDMVTSNKMGGKQTYLGNIEDKRITFNHLHNR